MLYAFDSVGISQKTILFVALSMVIEVIDMSLPTMVVQHVTIMVRKTLLCTGSLFEYSATKYSNPQFML